MPILQGAGVPFFITLVFYINSNVLIVFSLWKHVKVRWYTVVLFTLCQAVLYFVQRAWLWPSTIPIVLFYVWVYHRAIDIDSIKLLYVQLTVTTHQVVLGGIMSLAQGPISAWGWSETGIFLGFSLVTTAFMLWLLRKRIWPRLEPLRVHRIRRVWMLPFLFAILILLGSSHMQFLLGEMDSGPYILMTSVFSLAAICSCYIALIILERTDDAANYAANLHLMDIQLATEAKRFGELTQYMEDVRILRHDMKHNLMVMEMLLGEEKYEELGQYLQAYHTEADQQDAMSYSANLIGDLIARHTQLRAQAAGVTVNIACLLPADCWISDIDLCIILGNLTENALNACRTQREGEKTISGSARITGREAIIVTENSCDMESTPAHRAGSDMFANQGYGIPSIIAIAKKYNGTARFEKKDGIFRSVVLLYEPAKGP